LLFLDLKKRTGYKLFSRFWRRFSYKPVTARNVEWLSGKPYCCWLNKSFLVK